MITTDEVIKELRKTHFYTSLDFTETKRIMIDDILKIISNRLEKLVRQGVSSADVACGHWKDAQIFKPEPKTDVLFLAEFDGKLHECYGFYVDENLWMDKSTQDRDGDYYEVYSTRYWLKLDIKPSA